MGLSLFQGWLLSGMPAPPDTLEFARRLRRLREQAGWTQKELAERSGLSRNYIGLLELSRREPSLSTLLAISQALSSSLDELAGSSKLSAGVDKTPPMYRGPQASRILQSMTGCSRADADTIAGIVESCARLARRR